ncbi:CotH kinase family protein [Paenibacillus sp. HWE-109]|uniref:CotH kinase family protein n=1 Tax=Paenibacillus sp. HWE-109 TaxID=1306526 RepID=UPI001EDC9D43|nr:CotH kinase family protein [Paenibacillus sp. HWE-109]UKS29175.1 CotH kinase family protein [Paenibacillus sp. HWE-109]
MIPTRHIVIQEQQLRKLNEDVWSKQYVNGVLISKGQRGAIKVRYRGGHTREYAKKSFEIVSGGRTYHLNAEYDDPSMIRNALSFRFFQKIGVPSPQTKHIHLKLNGVSQGVYLEIEAVDKNFFQFRKIGVQSLFYAVDDDANFETFHPETKKAKKTMFEGYEQIMGLSSEKKELRRFIAQINQLSRKPLAYYINSQLDVDNYLRWLAGAVFTGNFDGFDQNYAIYRHKPTKLYRIIPWDYEGTWGRNCYGKVCGSDLVRVKGYNGLTEKLLGIQSARLRYKQILSSILRSSFTWKQIGPIVEHLHGNIAPYMKEDSYRKWPYSEFKGEPELIRNYVQERRLIIKQELKKL